MYLYRQADRIHFRLYFHFDLFFFLSIPIQFPFHEQLRIFRFKCKFFCFCFGFGVQLVMCVVFTKVMVNGPRIPNRVNAFGLSTSVENKK